MLTAVSIILVYFIHFPVFAAVPQLEYDMADMPILIGTFMFGPAWGLLLTAAVSLLQALVVSPASGWVGAVMHLCATGTYVLCAGLIYKKNRTMKGAIIGVVVGAVAQVAIMVPLNLTLTVHYNGVPFEAMKAMIWPYVIPFNAIKAGVNSCLTFLLYKRIEKVLNKF